MLISTLNMEKIAIVLGLLTASLALVTFASSRSFVFLVQRLGLNLLGNRVYKGYYRFHGYYWLIFGIVLFIHVSMGLIHIVLSTFVYDPDAYLHRYVLATGLTSLVFVGAIMTSCRSLLGFLGIVFLKNPLSLDKFKLYYKLHSYFWLFFLLPIAGHYIFGYIHAGGFWPQ